MVACPPFMRVHACECVQACMQWHTMPPQPPGTLGHHNPWHALACWHPGIGTHSPAGTLALVPTRLLAPWHWHPLACWGSTSPLQTPRHPLAPTCLLGIHHILSTSPLQTLWHPTHSSAGDPRVPPSYPGTLPTRLLGIHQYGLSPADAKQLRLKQVHVAQEGAKAGGSCLG